MTINDMVNELERAINNISDSIDTIIKENRYTFYICIVLLIIEIIKFFVYLFECKNKAKLEDEIKKQKEQLELINRKLDFINKKIPKEEEWK